MPLLGIPVSHIAVLHWSSDSPVCLKFFLSHPPLQINSHQHYVFIFSFLKKNLPCMSLCLSGSSLFYSLPCLPVSSILLKTIGFYCFGWMNLQVLCQFSVDFVSAKC